MKRFRVLLSFMTLSTFAMSARGDFSYPDFSTVAGLQLNGNAAQAGNVLRLTPATFWQSGSAFTTEQVDLGGGNSFSTFFQFRIDTPGGISDEDGSGADGIVFVVQTVSNNVGGAGGGIGYAGISPSVGVEFDTYNNGVGFGDPNGNHVGINTNGSLASLSTQIEPVRFNNGAVWNAWIDYNGVTDLLEVRWSPNVIRPELANLSRVIDLTAVLGQTTAYVGFTSGTGAAFGNHDILRWEFRGEFAPIPGVPEPSSIILMSSGAIGLFIARRYGRRR